MIRLDKIDWNRVSNEPLEATNAAVPFIQEQKPTPTKAKIIIGLKISKLGIRLFLLMMAMITILIMVDVSKQITNGEIDPPFDLVQINSLICLLAGAAMGFMMLRTSGKL